MADRTLKPLLDQLISRFPAARQSAFLEPAAPAAWEALSARYPSGPGQRWFAAVGGQQGEELFFDGYRLLSLAEAAALCGQFDERRQSGAQHWVGKDWIAIAQDQLGGHLMLDDRDGRVLVVHDDDADVETLAPSAEHWLATLSAGCAAGKIVWRLSHGLVEQAALAQARQQLVAYEAAQRPKPKMLPAKLVGVALMWVLIYLAAKTFLH